MNLKKPDEKMVSEIFCPYCGALVIPQGCYCPFCGASIEDYLKEIIGA